MTKIVNLECLCGAVKGKLKVVPGAFFHVQCFCCDCQRFASNLHNEQNILDEHGATELLQTYPAYMEITEGQDKIRCMQLSSKGLYRWHTACCHMPLANTLHSPRVPFVGISVKLMQFSSEQQKNEALGPISLKVFGKYAIGGKPEDAHPTTPISFLPKILVFMLKGLLGRKYSPSPFFKQGEPVAKAHVIS